MVYNNSFYDNTYIKKVSNRLVDSVMKMLEACTFGNTLLALFARQTRSHGPGGGTELVVAITFLVTLTSTPFIHSLRVFSTTHCHHFLSTNITLTFYCVITPCPFVRPIFILTFPQHIV